VKNLRVANVEDTDYMYLEIVSGKASEIELILSNYRSGQFESMFPDYIRMSDVQEPFSFSVDVDESKARLLVAGLNRLVFL
jgi:hypothetical protein